MTGSIPFTLPETRQKQLFEIIDQIRKQSQHAQNLFYYHEEDQLKQKDKCGWNAVEYLEHFNMLLYHQIDIIKRAESTSKGINVSKFLGKILDSFGYKSIIRTYTTQLLIEHFKPISISNPNVILNPQKVFQDLIYGCEEFIHLMENEKKPYKVVIDKRIPGLLTQRGKAQFLAEYFRFIIQHCSHQV